MKENVTFLKTENTERKDTSVEHGLHTSWNRILQIPDLVKSHDLLIKTMKIRQKNIPMKHASWTWHFTNNFQSYKTLAVHIFKFCYSAGIFIKLGS